MYSRSLSRCNTLTKSYYHTYDNYEQYPDSDNALIACLNIPEPVSSYGT